MNVAHIAGIQPNKKCYVEWSHNLYYHANAPQNSRLTVAAFAHRRATARAGVRARSPANRAR